MKRILMVTVATIILLWPASPTTAQASSILQTRSFRTNLAKGEYVEAEAEEIITDRAEIAESEPLDEQEPQESDGHTDVSTPTDIESAVDDGELEELEQLEEPTQSQLDAPENIGVSTEPEVETPVDSEEEEEHETEVQGSE